jgi:hypothetical protein
MGLVMSLLLQGWSRRLSELKEVSLMSVYVTTQAFRSPSFPTQACGD